MTALVLTPFSSAEAVELAAQTWRKKLLPIGEIDYKGRTLRFTRDYLGRLVSAFNDRAYDQVALQLADAQNTHTNDPERFRGEVTGMDLGDDGLYVTVKTTEAGSRVLEDNPRLGVSARIVEGYARSDGRHFPAAVQHVLATLDPRIPGLGPWQAIEAASPEPDLVVDLSQATFAEPLSKKEAKARRKAEKAAQQQTDPAGDGTDDTEGGSVMADLTSEQQARLARLLTLPDDTLDALANGGVVLTPDEVARLTTDPDDDAGNGGEEGEDGDDLAAQVAAMSDEDLAALEAEWAAEQGTETPGFTPGYMPEGEPVAAGLTAEQQFAFDLANAQAAETARELAVVTARLREQDFLAERDRLFHNFGVPPFITDLARPLLEGAGRVVEMANGQSVDAGQVMRKVLTEMAALGGLRDLGGAELGTPMDEPEGVQHEEAVRTREGIVRDFKAVTGLR